MLLGKAPQKELVGKDQMFSTQESVLTASLMWSRSPHSAARPRRPEAPKNLGQEDLHLSLGDISHAAVQEGDLT